MKTLLVECPKCGAKNRIPEHSDRLKPVCGRCGTALSQHNYEQTIVHQTEKSGYNNFPSFLFILLLVAAILGIIVTPALMHKDFSLFIADELQKTELLEKQYEEKLAIRKESFEKELADISGRALHRKASEHYRNIYNARKSFDKRFALSPREKAQLRMRNLASHSTKTFHDAIRSVAQEASPDGAEISIHESSKGIALYIDFDMSSMTSGEYGTRTKHHTQESLTKEVVSLTSRVTNDIFQFCRSLGLSSIHVGCRHYVTTIYPDGSTKKENMILYKIRIEADKIPKLTTDPFLNTYSTTKYFKVEENNFDKIKIKITRI